MLEEQSLDPERHDRAGFSCGVRELDEYLHRFATQHRRKGVSNVYVLVDTATPSLILGYYTLSAAQVDAADLRDADRTLTLQCEVDAWFLSAARGLDPRASTISGIVILGASPCSPIEGKSGSTIRRAPS